MKTATIIIAIVIAVIAVGGLASYLTTSQPKAKEFKLEAQEFGYGSASGGPKLTVKAGETVKVTLVNKGAVDHEFRIVKDKDAFLLDVDKAVQKLQAQGIKDQDGVEKSQGFKDARRATGLKIIKAGGEPDWDADVEKGESKTFEFSVDAPGTYYYVCGELDATFPQVHAHRGMFAQIVVAP